MTKEQCIWFCSSKNGNQQCIYDYGSTNTELTWKSIGGRKTGFEDEKWMSAEKMMAIQQK